VGNRASASVGCDAVQTRSFGQATRGAQVRERTVGIDAERTEGAAGRVQRVKELPVSAHCNVQVTRTGRIGSHDGAGYCCQRAEAAIAKPETVELPAFET
jgi:hypothetical protein